MLRRLSLLLVLLWASVANGAYTEFYCNASTGSNVNAGSTEGSALITSDEDSWVSATGVYTFGAATDLSGVSAGMFAAVRVDGATVAALVGRIKAVDDGADTVTISTTAKSGSLADQTDTASIAIGGAWKGPNAAEDFPLDFITAAQTNSSGDAPRVNLKNNAQYDITASIAPNQVGPIFVEGYTTTPGDGGAATIDGGTSGASYALLATTATADYWCYKNLAFQNNGASGTASGITIASACTANILYRVRLDDVRGQGFAVSGAGSTFVECTVDQWNQSAGGFSVGVNLNAAGCRAVRCIARNGAGSGTHGIGIGSNSVADHCISYANGGRGFYINLAFGDAVLRCCDAYANGGDAFYVTFTTNKCMLYLENSNAVDNGGAAFGNDASGAGACTGLVRNLGVGSGTAANTGGMGSTSLLQVDGTVTYAADVTPWVDPANGDFRINLPAAKGAGRGTFLGGGSTVAYPDIGAAQSRQTPYPQVTGF